MLRELGQVWHPLIHLEPHLAEARGDESLDRPFFSRLAVELNQALQEFRDLGRLRIDGFHNLYSLVRRHDRHGYFSWSGSSRTVTLRLEPEQAIHLHHQPACFETDAAGHKGVPPFGVNHEQLAAWLVFP